MDSRRVEVAGGGGPAADLSIEAGKGVMSCGGAGGAAALAWRAGLRVGGERGGDRTAAGSIGRPVVGHCG